MKLVYEFVVQAVADDYIAVTVGEDIDKFGGLIRLDIMNLLRQETTEEEIAAALKEKYVSGDEIIEKAVHDFVQMLIKEGLVG